MKLVLFFLCFIISGCKDNLTLNQISFRDDIKYKVTIEGHINKPGMYLINKDNNINELIKLASGYKDGAIKLSANLVLKDNMKLFVYSNNISSKININTASNQELTTIKGIGPAIAKKIIDYRQKYGNFKSISDIKKIKGIKEKLFTKIYEYLKI